MMITSSSTHKSILQSRRRVGNALEGYNYRKKLYFHEVDRMVSTQIRPHIRKIQKVITCIISIALCLGVPLAALADEYDRLMKSSEFHTSGGDRCKNKKIEARKGSNKITYELCLLKGKPIILRTYNDGTMTSESGYKKGKLVYTLTSEFGDGIGFRNDRPVVEWHYGEYDKRGVNWNLTSEQKSDYLSTAAENRRILLKFGIR